MYFHACLTLVSKWCRFIFLTRFKYITSVTIVSVHKWKGSAFQVSKRFEIAPVTTSGQRPNMSVPWAGMWGRWPLVSYRRKKNAHVKKKRRKFWEIWLPHKVHVISSYDKCGFCLLKKVLKRCDYDKSLQFAWDTEERMNGHVKRTSFQQYMDLTTSKFYSNLFSSIEMSHSN